MEGIPGLPSLDRVALLLSRFPGVGRKSAQRMVHHLLRQGRGEIDTLVSALATMGERVRSCRICFNLAEEELCWVCNNPTRDGKVVCVVEESGDLMAIERAGIFQGVYHVLGGHLSPLEGLGPEELHVQALEVRLDRGEIDELILATNPTVAGEATAHYIAHLAQSRGVRLTRLAYGLPMGGELEYLDESTVYQALAWRREY
ncbi:MAG: recombination protein RecR [Magnetococcales bacterium]|nr:recombination protein RecR [Magnetococcales bacterium]